MAHRATLHLGTATGVNQYDIVSFHYEFNQSLMLGPVHGVLMRRLENNLAGMMSWTNGEVTGGTIELTIATLPDSDTIFHRWMFSRWRPMSGRIIVDMDSPNGGSRTLTIVFNTGYCTYLKDNFNSQKDEFMTTTIKITCQQMIVGTNIPAVWPAFL